MAGMTQQAASDTYPVKCRNARWSRGYRLVARVATALAVPALLMACTPQHVETPAEEAASVPTDMSSVSSAGDDGMDIESAAPDVPHAAVEVPPFIINILQDGTVRVEGRTVEMDDLRDRLASVAEHDAGRQVLIRADQESLHRYFARVAGMCREVGLGRIEVGHIFDDSP